MQLGQVDKINQRVSGTLWTLLDVHYGFKNNLLAMRNTYLMGRGELFQNVLDDILNYIGNPMVSAQEPDVVLNRKILRNTAKLLNLDEVAFTRVMEMRLNSPNLALTSLTDDCINICGSAKHSRHSSRRVTLTTIQPQGFSAIFTDLWRKQQV